MRIRKLTPRETRKLMRFNNVDFDRANKVCTETNLYHQTRNSIVVNVKYSVLKELFK